jgi:hypothetical protein
MAKLQIDGKDIAEIDDEYAIEVMKFFAEVKAQVASLEIRLDAPPPPMPQLHAPSPWQQPYEVGWVHFGIQWQKTRNEPKDG